MSIRISNTDSNRVARLKVIYLLPVAILCALTVDPIRAMGIALLEVKRGLVSAWFNQGR